MSGIRRIVASLLGVAALLALAAGSDVPLPAHGADEGRIRLSWRAVGQRIEECRQPSEEELAALPAHMRRDEICEGRLAPFSLRVRIDGESAIDREVRPSGAREDRPTYVLEEIPVEPGSHRIEVDFAVALEEGPSPGPPLRLRAQVEVEPRGVVLVTHDEASGSLVLRRR